MRVISKLKELLDISYAPYSNFRVSAIVVCKDNKCFSGVNVENASYGATICAERVAITKAISNGYKKGDFKSIYIMCDSDKISSCCFLCRQVIVEFFDPDALIVLYNREGKSKMFKVSDMCPYPFDSDDLF